MSAELLSVLDQFEREKGIPRDTLFAMVESALLQATVKAQGPARDLRCQIDRKTGDIKAFARLSVVTHVTKPFEQISLSEARKRLPSCLLGQTYEIEVTPKDMGRIAAQAVKQAIMQGLRGEEKKMIYDEFRGRVNDIVTGTVRRFVKSDVVIDLGKFEGIMPQAERVPTEEYQVGDRLRALVLSVEMTTRGPEIILSRSHPNFVRRLFELECNELTNGAVEIRAMAREPGYRTKIAVGSKQDKVDPVGACVGIRGSRVKNIVRELNNERVDIFRWSDNIRELVVEALKPAKLKALEFDETNRRVTVTVDDENLSLAIGKRGQNARLTQKLTGWEIDIRRDESAEEQFQGKVQKAAEDIAAKLGVSVDVARLAVVYGFPTIEALKEADAGDLEGAIPDAEAAAAIAGAIARLKEPAPAAVETPAAAEPETSEKAPAPSSEG
ncbi:MAG: transcription termination/antitermination protein NusA [Verrucomicrobiae bacterium]|nr:transcription termination/antitermination protein NusA [Verrucomicrobiae bacterium]